jgi:diacylglycerol kinase family enzyme
MKIFFLAKSGLHLKETGVVLKKTSNIKLMTDQAIEIDGDYFGDGPAEIFIKKRAIRFKI